MWMLYLRQVACAPRLHRGMRFHIDRPEAQWQVVGTWDLERFVSQVDHFSAQQKFIYLQQEPPGMRWPTAEMVQRFTALLTPLLMEVAGPAQFIGPPCLCWTYGIHMEMREGVGHWFSEQGGVHWDTLCALEQPKKERLCSMVVSQKAFLPGHQARLNFVHTLQDHFQNKIDFFGFGSQPIPDKRTAIDPYLFSIAVENSVHPNYWTEKIADIYLGYGMPIYYGAPNIHHYFSEQSLQQINIDKPDEAISIIENLLENPHRYDAQSVAEARHAVLHEHNYLDWIARGIQQLVV